MFIWGTWAKLLAKASVKYLLDHNTYLVAYAFVSVVLADVCAAGEAVVVAALPVYGPPRDTSPRGTRPYCAPITIDRTPCPIHRSEPGM